MTAAAERAELAAIGGDLAGLDGAGWRARALLGANDDAPVTFADLAQVPAWLRGSREELTALARMVALIAMAPALAASIDGAWLGELAELAGEPALDHAIALAPEVPGGGLPPLPAEAIDGLGFDLLRAVTPSALARYLAWGEAGLLPVPAELACFCIARATGG